MHQYGILPTSVLNIIVRIRHNREPNFDKARSKLLEKESWTVRRPQTEARSTLIGNGQGSK